MTKRILLFDEAYTLGVGLKQAFTYTLPEVEFDIATTYKEAYEKVIFNKYDLIMIDLMIPIYDEDKLVNPELDDVYSTGLHFYRHLKKLFKDNTISQMPSIFIYSAKESIDSTQFDNNVILRKPQRPIKIINKVKRTLELV
ncbi:DNA-binding transcriptional response regulator [Portibacter lacus]|uniref:Uncharacterized protein n=1 Tax=Portibacter lacus TaxID=1099794 RepID=A0AA37SNW4_9BACT|nr:hypothetical protein [Portibacter lacus]GLR16008.1 hypothetical protein GCM10007940_06230 [Portibacter lacus]